MLIPDPARQAQFEAEAAAFPVPPGRSERCLGSTLLGADVALRVCVVSSSAGETVTVIPWKHDSNSGWLPWGGFVMRPHCIGAAVDLLLEAWAAVGGAAASKRN